MSDEALAPVAVHTIIAMIEDEDGSLASDTSISLIEDEDGPVASSITLLDYEVDSVASAKTTPLIDEEVDGTMKTISEHQTLREKYRIREEITDKDLKEILELFDKVLSVAIRNRLKEVLVKKLIDKLEESSDINLV